MSWNRIAAFVSALLFLSTEASQAQNPYTVFDLGTFGGTSSNATAINGSGQVTGYSFLEDDQIQNTFLVSSGQMARNLGTLGGTNSFGYAINASGRVAGVSQMAGNGTYHAFLSYANGGALSDLGTLGGTNSYAYGVNDAGRVVGYSQTAGNTATRAFISGANGGSLVSLGTLAGGTNSYAFAVNASGQVAGYSGTASGFNHAFISAPNGGPLRDLGTLGGRVSFGLAINNFGQVTGRSEASSGQRAFLSGPNGGPLLDLGTLGGLSSFGQGINDFGAVVGYSFLSDNSTAHAFLYTAATGMVDLNMFIAPASGWTLTEGRDINELGQIVGVGIFEGESHGFLLNPDGLIGFYSGLGHAHPVPEPTTILLLLAGLVGVVANCQRTKNGRFRAAVNRVFEGS